MLKVVGVRIPEMVVGGIFLSKEGLLFYEIQDLDKCITVELKNAKYRKIISEVSDRRPTKMIHDALDRLH